MPGSIRGAVSNGTFPTSLSTKFVRAQSVQARVNEYHDGTTQRSALVDESRRTWQLAKRLTATDLATLRDFWQANPNTAFTFYDPFETVPPFTQNPTTTDGAYLVRFNSDWNETIGMVRSDAGVELIEMTASPGGSGPEFLLGGSADFGSASSLYVQGDWSAGMWVYLPANAHGALIGMGNAGATFDASGGAPYPYLLTVGGGPSSFSITYVHDYSDASGLGHEYLTFAANIPVDAWTYVGASRSVAAKTVTLYTSDGTTITTVGTQSFSHDPAFYDSAGSVSPTGAVFTLGELNYASMASTPANSLFYPVVNEIASAYMWNVTLTSAQHLAAAQNSIPATGLVFSAANLGNTPPVDSVTSTTATLSGTVSVDGPAGAASARYF